MDPLTAATAVAKASDTEAGKSTVRLVERMLGPSADVIGKALASYTERRLQNVDRIARKAAQKRPNAQGAVNPRVAHRLLEEGSYVEDQVMAEYLAGVLAASKSSAEGDSDDRAVPITALVAAMSADQIKAHFIFYRTWVKRAAETHTPVAVDGDRLKLLIRANAGELFERMGKPLNGNELQRFVSVLAGLARHDLIAAEWEAGPRRETDPVDWWAYVTTSPTPFGFELYAWALGDPDYDLSDLAPLAEQQLDDALPAAIHDATYPRAPESTPEDSPSPDVSPLDRR